MFSTILRDENISKPFDLSFGKNAVVINTDKIKMQDIKLRT